MRTRLMNIWVDARTSYWFLPLLMALCSTLLALVTIELDHRLELDAENALPVQFAGGANAARSMLTTIAGSIIMVGGVVFSILILALSNASSQFGPRILRTFMSDSGSQISLGTFISTFIYSVLVLGAVRGQSGTTSFVPFISVTIAVALALITMVVLIYFLHHSAGLINVTTVQARLGREMLATLRDRYPVRTSTSDTEDAVSLSGARNMPLPDGSYSVIAAEWAGYVEAIDYESLVGLARAHNVVIRVVCEPGDFAIPGADLAHIWPASEDALQLSDEINAMFMLGPRRQTMQEVRIYFDELTEIALRALSPAINDPFTAITSIEWLTAGFTTMVRRQQPSRYVYDSQGSLRLVKDDAEFGELINSVFDQIREFTGNNLTVLAALLEAITAIAPCTQTSAQRQLLRRHATTIDRWVRSRNYAWHIHADFRRAYREAIVTLNAAESLAQTSPTTD